MSTVENPLEAFTLDQLQQRSSWKWQTYPRDVLPMWVAEMDVALAEPVVQAITRAAATGDTGYPVGHELAAAFAGFAARRWGWSSINPSTTAVVPDVLNGFAELLTVLTDPGDAVVVNPPVYSPFYAYTTHRGRRIVHAQLGENSRISLDALDQAFRIARAQGRPAVYLMCSPHNPTGVVHTRDELVAIVELARRHDVRIVSNEVHAPLVYSDSTFTPLLTVPGSERFFALTSASKAWNLAGLKAALLLGGEDATDDIARMPSWFARCASHVGVLAQTAAFRDGGEWLDALLRGLEDNRALLEESVAAMPQISWLRPQGTYMAWLDCRGLGGPDEAPTGAATFSDMVGPAKLFHDKARVAMTSGHVFGPGGAGHVRLNFGTSNAILTEGLRRMGEALS